MRDLRAYMPVKNASSLDEDYFKFLFCYANEYKKNGKNFINCYLKFKSVRSVCEQICLTAWKVGLLYECLQANDFTEWCNKLNIDDKWKEILNFTLVLINSIIK